MNIQPIYTKRLKIRSYTADDLAFVIGIWGDPKMGKYLIDPNAANISSSYFETLKTLHESDDCYYLIAESLESGFRIGTCSFAYDKETKTADLGYAIHEYFWKQGFGSEMVQTVVNFAETLGATRFTAQICKDNAGSNALVRKLGFHVISETTSKKAGSDFVMNEYIYERKL